MSAERDRLLTLLTERAFQRRKVKLSSGRESDFYIDCKKVMLRAEGHFLVGKALFQLIRRAADDAVGVGGLTLGADPIASAVSLTSFVEGRPLHAFIVRKEPKGHGTGAWVEGLSAFSPRDPVAIVEDVVTTGGSTLKAIERVRLEGLTPIGAFALVDRQEGGREAIERVGVPVHALFTKKDFIP